MIAHRRPWAHASNLNLRRNSHLSESDKSGFSPQIQKAHIAKQPSTDQRPSLHRPSLDTSMVRWNNHAVPRTQHPQSTSGQRPWVHRPSSDTCAEGIQQPPIHQFLDGGFTQCAWRGGVILYCQWRSYREFFLHRSAAIDPSTIVRYMPGGCSATAHRQALV